MLKNDNRVKNIHNIPLKSGTLTGYSQKRKKKGSNLKLLDIFYEH